MKLISKADLYKKSSRELEGLKEAFRKVAGNCELTRREACAAIQEIRTLQGPRRVARPNH
jgi:hypothetical protein